MTPADPPRISRRAFVQSLVAGSTLGLQPSLPVDAPIEIKSGVAQMFVDDYLIVEQNALRRTLRQPKKDDGGNVPVIALDKEFGEFGATLEANGTILYDPRLKKHVMFALAFSSPMPGPDRVRLYRFTSDDAMTWIKGDDGSPQRILFDLKDAASGESATNIDLFSCCYDAADDRYPYKGWLHFANWEKSGKASTWCTPATAEPGSAGQCSCGPAAARSSRTGARSAGRATCRSSITTR